ncbi:hypothetical protein [Variovorax sp. RA8]|uniref:hypothetical protein n=1 Tax=Variovorax sp. (strain JCM 16519 / RA8) TaxID=662548 RepID=UPI001318F67C|nr:hypothetical protein [Variovorax sp. RA8]VTU13438.1 hypothetical protein RA8CHR_00089 [Variovorax sp. RA8]
MPRHDAASPVGRWPRRHPDDEKRDEQVRRLAEEHDKLRAARPNAGPAEEDEQPQSPGAKPLHKTQQQQH